MFGPSPNVIASAVREQNLKCFSLESSKKQAVEIDVIMAEPNDNSGKQNEIIIRPRQVLQSNTVYVLIVCESLQAHNQKRLGFDKVITFTTGSANVTSTDESTGLSIA